MPLPNLPDKDSLRFPTDLPRHRAMAGVLSRKPSDRRETDGSKPVNVRLPPPSDHRVKMLRRGVSGETLKWRRAMVRVAYAEDDRASKAVQPSGLNIPKRRICNNNKIKLLALAFGDNLPTIKLARSSGHGRNLGTVHRKAPRRTCGDKSLTEPIRRQIVRGCRGDAQHSGG